MAKKSKIQSPKGMHDILPNNQPYWQQLINTFEEISICAGYQKIDTPIVESIDLFTRSIGDTSDIVSKEMYILENKSKDGTQYVLRPEFTAPIARSYIQHGLSNMPKPVRLFTHGPLFRYNKPQTGRIREFHQLDLEQIKMDSPVADAEIISIVWQLFENIGLSDTQLHINTIGNMSSRKNIINLLIDYFHPHKNKLCVDCQNRLIKNPIRIFDCKDKKCQSIIKNAPQIIDHIDQESKKHFYELLEYLDELEIPYILNPYLVRGLDYYSKTVFEFIPSNSDQSLGGGGRYDDLFSVLGGEPTPAVGVGLGIERIVFQMIANKTKLHNTCLHPDIYLVQLGDNAKKKCFRLLHQLRTNKLKVSSNLNKKSISTQLKSADRQHAKIALIIGQKEAMDNTVIIRDMKSGVQDTVDMDYIVSEIQKRLA